MLRDSDRPFGVRPLTHGELPRSMFAPAIALGGSTGRPLVTARKRFRPPTRTGSRPITRCDQTKLVFMFPRNLLLLALAGCQTVAPATVARSDEPALDTACLDHARHGTLLSSLPAKLGAFEIATKNATTFTLHRAGRPFTDAEGKTLWEQIGAASPLRGLSMGSSALYSIDKCPGIADGGCLTFSIHLCQTNLETIAAQLEAAAKQAPDAELFVTLTAHEAGGPACKDGPRCVPTAHYSTKDEPYRSTPLRNAIPKWSGGACRDDGDCEGGGNICQSWYLRGNAELAIAIEHSQPTFCGCVAKQCTWFTQE